MDRLLHVLAAHWLDGTKLAMKCKTFAGDIGPSGHSLPLRIASGLHALVLRGDDPKLCAIYPPNTADNTSFRAGILQALHDHDDFLCDWIESAPQTNEVRRSAVLIATAHLLAARFKMPFRLSELGASAGLNLMFDRFCLDIGEGYGPPSGVNLTPEWSGSHPPKAKLDITLRRGVDLNPINSHEDAQALRLQAYLWADQQDRLERTRAAIRLQNAEVDKGDAIDWLETRLRTAVHNQLHLIYHSVAWQYFPKDKQTLGTEMIQAAGARATEHSPLAWLSYEADAEPHGARIVLRLWPGNHRVELGRADFHGRWVNWQAPTHLT